MAFKIPSRYQGSARSAFDPLGVNAAGSTDLLFGKAPGPDYSATDAQKAQALANDQAATDAFKAGGPAKYNAGNNLDWQTLSAPTKQGDTNFGGISTNPKYKDAELGALTDLQNQGKVGLTAQDHAALAESQLGADAANRGRIGAITQNMQARGLGGSGLDLVAKLQSGQDANQTEALRALEIAGQGEQARRDATAKAGNLGGSLESQDFGEQAAKAQAQDAINRFNTQNSNQAAQYNNVGQNATNADNWNRANTTADRNSGSQYQFNKDVLGAQQGQNQQSYNAATDTQNMQRLDNQAAEQRAGGAMGAALGAVGGIVGGIYGGPQGATAGATVGSGVGQAGGRSQYRNQSYWQGGKVPGKASVPGDNPMNDTVSATVAPGSVVVPRSAAANPATAAKFVANTNGNDGNHDAIGHLLKAMAAMHSKGGK